MIPGFLVCVILPPKRWAGAALWSCRREKKGTSRSCIKTKVNTRADDTVHMTELSVVSLTPPNMPVLSHNTQRYYTSQPLQDIILPFLPSQANLPHTNYDKPVQAVFVFAAAPFLYIVTQLLVNCQRPLSICIVLLTSEFDMWICGNHTCPNKCMESNRSAVSDIVYESM